MGLKKIKLDIAIEALYKPLRTPASDGGRGPKLETDILKCKADRHVLQKSLDGHVFLP